MKTFVLCLLLVAVPVTAQSSTLWQDENSPPSAKQNYPLPTTYRLVRADATQLLNRLDKTGKGQQQNLSIPLPDHTFLTLAIRRDPIMAPALAAKYPEIQTFHGIAVHDSSITARLDLTPAGFHAIVFMADRTIYIDPYPGVQKAPFYMSYDKRAVPARGIIHPPEAKFEKTVGLDATRSKAANGAQRRTYRIAIAATAEYTLFHGGAIVDGLAAIVTTLNRINGIYERDLSIRFELVANNDQVIYTNPSTDPYTNSNGSLMLNQNQNNLDRVIGNANYDIGHIVSTGAGGVAIVGACVTGFKARGATGSPQPVNDPFDVDFVAHEIGHQFSADHTWNGTQGSCLPSQWAATSAYEPGSGSTIMSYAGICEGDNLQPSAQDNFHSRSIDQILSYVSSDSASNCGTVTPTNNTPPQVDAGPDYVIPVRTPFALTGRGQDFDGDKLTYSWEQFDVSASMVSVQFLIALNSDGPIFRVFSPTPSPTRIFPSLDSVLIGVNSSGEVLPTMARTLNFRLIARDNRGGINDDAMLLNVVQSAGPFQVLSPATLQQAGSTGQVDWVVANTDQAPIACGRMDLFLSLDNGSSFPVMLASLTPNDGAELVTLPSNASNTARFKAICSDNVFFNISPPFILADATDLSPAPLFIGDSPVITTTEATRTTLRFQLNANSTLFYVLLPNNALSPSATDVINETNAIIAGHTQAVANVSQTFVLTGLMPETAYDLYLVAHDNVTQAQSLPFRLDISTLQASEENILNFSRVPNQPIPDANPEGVSDTLLINSDAVIEKLSVNLNISHSYVGNLRVVLDHVESGIQVMLLDQPGEAMCDGDNLTLTLDDAAVLSVQNNCVSNNTGPAFLSDTLYRPAQPLNVFSGQPLAGNWRLTIVDDGVFDTGQLFDWALLPQTANMTLLPNATALNAISGMPLTTQAAFAVNLGTGNTQNPLPVTVTQSENINLRAMIQVDPADIGVPADIIIAAVYVPPMGASFAFSRQGEIAWQNWDGNPLTLHNAGGIHALPATFEIEVYQGPFTGLPGEFSFFVAYRTGDKFVLGTATPIVVTVL